MHGIALVDYDNVRDRDRPERSQPVRADHELWATDLVSDIALALRRALPDLVELDLRFYGGWIAENGRWSPSAEWLLPLVASLRGRRHGILVRPVLAATMARFPLVNLRGTIRLQSRKRRQKMVDGMLGFDALHFARNAAPPLGMLGIVSDDDDMIPALLTVHDANSAPTVWLRKRAVGSGLNDSALQRHGVSIQSLEKDTVR